MSERVWFNISQAAEFLGLGKSTVRRLIDAGDLRAFRHHGRGERPFWRIHRDDLNEYLHRCEQRVQPARVRRLQDRIIG